MEGFMNEQTTYQSFWDWFTRHEKELFSFEQNEELLLPQTLERIQEVHPDLVFEIGPEIDGIREFTISANGMKKAFSTVIELAEAAPVYDRWDIVPFRQPKDPQDIEVQIDDIVLAPSDLMFSYIRIKDKIDLNVYIEHFSEEDERMYHLVFILLDNVVGEYDVEMKIGSIDLYNMSDAEDPDALLQLSKLPAIIESLSTSSVH